MGAKPPWEEVACLGNACLVDAAIGSKLTPRRAEHVTQVRVCALLVAVSEPPSEKSTINYHVVYSRMECALSSDRERVVGWIHNHGRWHNARAIELYLYQYDSDRARRIGSVTSYLVGHSSMNSGWPNNVNVSMRFLAPTSLLQPKKKKREKAKVPLIAHAILHGRTHEPPTDSREDKRQLAQLYGG